ncbi:MAG: biotin--[acetyl-CoA-carboxylase] ligase [Anaerolineae bacterium]|nr:biotin--[acetyl-CoA-carboxylase] ligase [Anaerolineae bacterium]
MESELSQQALVNLLADVPFVSRVLYLRSTTSTNDILKRMAADGAPEGTLVLADEQTAGRGRLNRRWVAPAGTSLLFSLLFRPPKPSHGAPHESPLQYTMICSLAVRDAAARLLEIPIGLKWPNDLVHGSRKLGGILTEISTDAEGAPFVVVGIGLNVNWDPSAADFDYPATSLANAAGHPVERGAFLRAVVEGIACRYAELRAGKPPVREWEAALDTIGQDVMVELPGERITGVAVGVDADGALLVRTGEDTRRIVAGDVRVRTRDSAP